MNRTRPGSGLSSRSVTAPSYSSARLGALRRIQYLISLRRGVQQGRAGVATGGVFSGDGTGPAGTMICPSI